MITLYNRVPFVNYISYQLTNNSKAFIYLNVNFMTKSQSTDDIVCER